MKIGPLVTKFCDLALGGSVIMTHRVEWCQCWVALPNGSKVI